MPGSLGSPPGCGLVSPVWVTAGDTCNRPASFRRGIDTLAAPELYGPMKAITSGSLTARWALAVSSSDVHDCDEASASSQSRYSTFIPAISPPYSSMAIRMPLAMVSVCPRADPVRGMLDTIFRVFPPPERLHPPTNDAAAS